MPLEFAEGLRKHRKAYSIQTCFSTETKPQVHFCSTNNKRGDFVVRDVDAPPPPPSKLGIFHILLQFKRL